MSDSVPVTAPSQGQNNARLFMMHRGALLDFLAGLPSEHATYQAWEGGMSFLAQSDHLAGAASRLAAMMRGEKPEPVVPSSDFASALERLTANSHSTSALLAAMSDEQLAQVVPAFGGMQLPVAQMVGFMINHEAHHKGQIWLMARMIGLEPPRFIKLG
jgi:uncharacterized damage-inducible protein DinB